MQALGKGNIAKFVKLGLDFLLPVLWLYAALLTVVALGYAGVLLAINAGSLSADVLRVAHQTDFYLVPVKIHAEPGESFVWQFVLPVLLAAGVAVTGSIIIVQRLRRLLPAFSGGEPFTLANTKSLRTIWVTMMCMELARYAIFVVVSALVMLLGNPQGTPLQFSAPINFATWGAIFILIIMAEVLREGARLKQEQELTI